MTSSRHGAIRLWDLRNGSKPVVRYTGHLNSASSFIRCGFGAKETCVLSGSDDGAIHVWDAISGRPIKVLEGHKGSSYRAIWHSKQGLVVSCGEDGTVRLWDYQSKVEDKPDFSECDFH